MNLNEYIEIEAKIQQNPLYLDQLPEPVRAEYEHMQEQVQHMAGKMNASIQDYAEGLREMLKPFRRKEIQYGLKVWDKLKPYLSEEDINNLDKLEITIIQIGTAAADLLKRSGKKSTEEWDNTDWITLKKALLTQPLPTVHKEYDMLPNSAATYILKDFLQSGNERQAYSKGKVTYSPPNLITGAQNITYEGASAYLEITINKIREIGLKQDENARKLFNYILTKANEQNKNERIYFNLSDLVERGVYKTEHSAYKGVKLFFDKLMSIQVGGTQWAGYGKNKKEIRATKKQILIEYDVHEGSASFFEMKREIIDFLCMYYNFFPKWIYSLPNKAYALADHIYYIASQRKKEITKDGTFKISFDNIRQVLGLPDPRETQKHSEKIINPILKAIDDIEISQNVNTTMRMYLLPKYDENYRNAIDFLTGSLEITIDDETKKYISQRQHDKENKIKKTKQKKERAEHAARTKILMKKYEAEEIAFKEKANQ